MSIRIVDENYPYKLHIFQIRNNGMWKWIVWVLGTYRMVETKTPSLVPSAVFSFYDFRLTYVNDWNNNKKYSDCQIFYLNSQPIRSFKSVLKTKTTGMIVNKNRQSYHLQHVQI